MLLAAAVLVLFFAGLLFLLKTELVAAFMERSYPGQSWERPWRRFMVRFVGAAWVVFALAVLAQALF